MKRLSLRDNLDMVRTGWFATFLCLAVIGCIALVIALSIVQERASCMNAGHQYDEQVRYVWYDSHACYIRDGERFIQLDRYITNQNR